MQGPTWDEGEDTPKEGEKKDDEGKTCTSTHKCNKQSITGQCILADGHQGAHFCGWCASNF